MEIRIPEVYNECLSNREEAINILNDKTDWVWGLIFSVLYRDNDNKVQVIMAVGIKNCNDCGTNGTADSDDWTNTFYEYATDAHGPGFYRIIGDSGSNDITGTGGIGGDLYTTKVNINGTHYNVLNSHGETEVDDPFSIQDL